MAATHQEDIEVYLNESSCQFDVIKCLLECFSSRQIEIVPDGSAFLQQEAYTKKILDRFNMDQAKSIITPMECE